MRWKHRRIATLGAFALAFGGFATARAQTDANSGQVDSTAPHAIRIQYSAHEGCPDAVGFFSYVRARTQRLRSASVGEPADVATIAIQRSDGQSAGTLELPPIDGRPFTRRVEAGSCEEVVLALSLVLALAYDPDAITTFPSQVTAPAAPPPVAVPPATPPSTTLEPQLAPPSPSPPELPARFGAAAGFGAHGFSGIAPGLNAVLAPFVEYGSTSDRLWKPSGRVTLLFEVPSASVWSGGNATLLFFGGQVSGCPISVTIVHGVAAEPCFAFDLGQIIGSGQGVGDGDKTGNLLWAALEAIARVRATVAAPVFAEISGSGGVSLSQGKFVFVSDRKENTVFKIPTGFGSFGIALGVHFQ